jgi:hypothetical protein
MRVLLFFVFFFSLCFLTSATATESKSFAWCGGEPGLNTSFTSIEWQRGRDDPRQSTLTYMICSAQRHDITPLQFLSFAAPFLNIRWTHSICEERIDCFKSARVLQPDGRGYCLHGFMKLNYAFAGLVAATVTLSDPRHTQLAVFCLESSDPYGIEVSTF